MNATDRHVARINADAARHGPAVVLSSGRKFRLENPDGALLTPAVLARSLSRLVRWLGHTTEAITVAEHSVIVSRLCDPVDALAGLLHDGAEVCVSDVPTPVKVALGSHGRFEQLETRIEKAIAEAYGLPFPWPESVGEADSIALAWEIRDLLPPGEYVFRAGMPDPPARKLVPMGMRAAESAWLRRFAELTDIEEVA